MVMLFKEKSGVPPPLAGFSPPLPVMRSEMLKLLGAFLTMCKYGDASCNSVMMKERFGRERGLKDKRAELSERKVAPLPFSEILSPEMAALSVKGFRDTLEIWLFRPVASSIFLTAMCLISGGSASTTSTRIASAARRV